MIIVIEDDFKFDSNKSQKNQSMEIAEGMVHGDDFQSGFT